MNKGSFILRSQIGALIMNHADETFEGSFIKSDGALRDMRFHRSESQGVKGTGKGVPDADAQVKSGIIRVFDEEKGEWRTFNVRTAVRIVFRGIEFEVVDSISQVPDAKSLVLYGDGVLKRGNKRVDIPAVA